jgi:hypothetical protein
VKVPESSSAPLISGMDLRCIEFPFGHEFGGINNLRGPQPLAVSAGLFAASAGEIPLESWPRARYWSGQSQKSGGALRSTLATSSVKNVG